MEWTPLIDKIILEMLENRIPPSCIQSNILVVSHSILPDQKVVTELPCVKHIQDMSCVLKTVSKALAGMRIGNAKEVKQVHTDKTTKQQVQVTNLV